MFLLFLSRFPVVVLVILAGTLCVLALGIMVVLFSVLYSEAVCRRGIRVAHAIADVLRGHHAQVARSKRRVRND